MQEIDTKRFIVRFDHLKKRLVTSENSLNKLLLYFISEFKSKCQLSQRKKDIFLIKNNIWLDTEIRFPSNISIQLGKSSGRRSAFLYHFMEVVIGQKEEKRNNYSIL